MDHVPFSVSLFPEMLNLFAKLRAYRRATENLAIADAEFDAGVLSSRSHATTTAKYERARNELLAADARVRTTCP